MLLSLVKTVTVVAPADLSRCLPPSSNEIHTLAAFACVFPILPLRMAVECLSRVCPFMDWVFLLLCLCDWCVYVCVLPLIQYAHMNMCCMVTAWKPLTSPMCVGLLCSGRPLCVCVCVCVVRSRTESSPLLHLRVCLDASVCGVVKG